MAKQRVRVATTQDGSRVIATKRSPQQRANLSVRLRVEKNLRKRRVKKALMWTSIVHLLAALLLFYFIEPPSKHYDEVVHVVMVNEILEARKVIKPRPVKAIKHAEV
ncbi:MAG: hypothetical protein OXT74_19400, partial [Candidatus Poribacteria bacterium]|nr:hypothetical protein [Candidatus Poribacteria bacterium]